MFIATTITIGIVFVLAVIAAFQSSFVAERAAGKGKKNVNATRAMGVYAVIAVAAGITMMGIAETVL